MSGYITRALRAAVGPKNDITTSSQLAEKVNPTSRTWSGIDVTVEGAMSIAAFYDGVRIISEDMGKLPFPVYRMDSEEERVRDRMSPWWKVLNDAPNAWQDTGQFRELGTALAITRGNFYALPNVVRGKVVELLPLKSERVTIEQLEDMELLYHVEMSSGSRKTFKRREIFHLRGFSLDGIRGMGVVTLARESLGTTRAMERHGATVFGNGAHVSGVYKHPGALSDRAFEHLKKDIDDLKGEGANGTLILEEGMDWTQVGLSNEDAQFLESRKFQIAEIARWLRLPPHKLADLDRSTNNNIEHQSIEYVTDCLYSWAKRWERSVKKQLIGDQPYYAEILFDDLLRPTTKERFEAYRIAAGRPWMSGNEVRRRENLQRSDDSSMDEVILPKNLDAGAPSIQPGTEGTNAA